MKIEMAQSYYPSCKKIILKFFKIHCRPIVKLTFLSNFFSLKNILSSTKLIADNGWYNKRSLPIGGYNLLYSVVAVLII